MDIAINYWAVVACGVVSMVVGGIWYGPLFGKKWMEICEVDVSDIEARKKMQKEAMPLYAVQFLLVLFQVYVLAHFIAAWEDNAPVSTALWIAAAFVIPTIASASMWTNEASKIKWARFLIQAGYNLVMFVIFAMILTAWQ